MEDSSLFPSEFVSHAFYMPGPKGLAPFSFSGREYLIEPYDTPSKRLLLLFSRQCEKCVVLTSLLQLSSGKFIQAKDVQVGALLVGMSPDGTALGVGKVSWRSEVIFKKCLRVVTHTGKVLEAATTHPVRTRDAWTETGALTVGTQVATGHFSAFGVGTIFWEEVTAVEPIGRQPCLDFTVEGTSSFLADGLITHNSTTLGNKLITNSVLRPMFESLFIAPQEKQIKEFSKKRVEGPMRMSPLLRPYLKGATAVNNVLEKCFSHTESRINFRSVYFDADSTRGLSIDSLIADEIQDIRQDLFPVVEETMSHSPFKFKAFSGTPKSFDNTIQYYWSKFSTQYEWVIPCDRCGGGDYRYWNVISYESVQKQGLSCLKCGKLINARHPHARWASMRSPEWLANPPIEEPFEGYRIAQPMVAWLSWSEVYTKKITYSLPTFHNEVLGISYDTGEKLINEQALRTSSNPNLTPDMLKNYVGRTALYMGIDWGGGGSGSNSYTAISIGGYDNDKFAVPYMRRLEGMDAEPDNVMKIVIDLVNQYRIHLIGTDYGGGHIYNDRLIREFGILKVMRYQYVNTKLIYFDSTLMRWMCNRTEVIMAVLVNAINRTNVYMFPKWESWGEYCGSDFTNLLAEHSERTGNTQIIKVPGSTDDVAHSLLYCILASMVDHPRPDILQPDKEGHS